MTRLLRPSVRRLAMRAAFRLGALVVAVAVLGSAASGGRATLFCTMMGEAMTHCCCASADDPSSQATARPPSCCERRPVAALAAASVDDGSATMDAPLLVASAACVAPDLARARVDAATVSHDRSARAGPTVAVHRLCCVSLT